jgi:hypothetical protein
MHVELSDIFRHFAQMASAMAKAVCASGSTTLHTIGRRWSPTRPQREQQRSTSRRWSSKATVSSGLDIISTTNPVVASREPCQRHSGDTVCFCAFFLSLPACFLTRLHGIHHFPLMLLSVCPVMPSISGGQIPRSLLRLLEEVIVARMSEYIHELVASFQECKRCSPSSWCSQER